MVAVLSKTALCSSDERQEGPCALLTSLKASVIPTGLEGMAGLMLSGSCPAKASVDSDPIAGFRYSHGVGFTSAVFHP